MMLQDDDTDEFLAGAATRHDELGRDFMQLQARSWVLETRFMQTANF